MSRPDALLTQAERHVREGEERVARQAAIIEKLNRAGRGWAAEMAKETLATFATSLETARDHVRTEREQAACRPRPTSD